MTVQTVISRQSSRYLQVISNAGKISQITGAQDFLATPDVILEGVVCSDSEIK